MLVATAQLALAVPELLGHEHAGNEVASWMVAAAVGLLSAAHAPRRVPGFLPVITAAAVVLAAIAVRDVVSGHVHLEQELSHLLLVVGVVLLWALREPGGPAPRRDDVAAPVPGQAPVRRAPRAAWRRVA